MAVNIITEKAISCGEERKHADECGQLGRADRGFTRLVEEAAFGADVSADRAVAAVRDLVLVPPGDLVRHRLVAALVGAWGV